MSGRAAQDSIMDDSEEETCPLCVEEFDLSDKAFKPCPCGYQVCQFCVNNIRQNMNGLCPACRRPYDDKTIEIKDVNPEEYKADLRKKERLKAEKRKEEAQKREPDPKTQGRRHLAGIRVVQQKLVYVTGLSPNIKEEALHKTLIGDSFFGQYGKIIRLIVKKQPSRDGGSHYGIYVSYDTEEDAAKCISAVNGSQNGERTLRAQYGTTKYCSTYVRGDECTNKSCTFLHEESTDGNESFTREGLSKLNAIGTQGSAMPSISNAAPPQPKGVTQNGSAASPQVQIRNIPSSEAPTLPSTANWASKQIQPQILRRGSQATSQASLSPAITSTSIASAPLHEKSRDLQTVISSTKPPAGSPLAAQAHLPVSGAVSNPPESKAKPSLIQREPSNETQRLLNKLIKDVSSPDFRFVLNESSMSEEARLWAKIMPPLIDPEGGAKRRALREKDEEQRKKMHEAQAARLSAHNIQIAERNLDDEGPRSGSQQLGGEPEPVNDQNRGTARVASHAQTIQPPRGRSMAGILDRDTELEPRIDHFANLNVSSRTPALQRPGSSNRPSDINPPGLQRNVPTKPQQVVHPGQETVSGRGSSRFSFSTESAAPPRSAGLAPQKSYGAYTHPTSSHFTGAAVSGPPPGLKSAGTPPVSGGGMFAQGHGFTNAGMGLNNPSKDKGTDYSTDAYRGRGRTGGSDMSKQDPEEIEPALSVKVRDDDEEAKEPASAISEVSIKPQKIETLAQIIAASSPVEKKSISKPPSPAHSRVTSKNETDDILSKIESVVASIPRAQPRSANANRRGRASKSSTAEDARGKISSKTGDSGMVARSGRNNTTSDGADSASKHKPSNSIPQSQAAKKPAQPNTSESKTATSAAVNRATVSSASPVDQMKPVGNPPVEAIPTQSTRPIVKTLRIVPAKSLVVSALPTTPSEIKTGSDDSRDGRSGRSTQASQTPSTANLSSANPLSSATNQSIPNLASLILQSPRVREDRNSRGIEVESSQAPTKSSTSAETSLSRAESITRASSSGRSFTRTGAESIPDSRTISSETSRVRSDVNDEIGTDARSPQDPISTRSRQYKATEPEHAPVLGRKRKTKKVKSNVNSPLVSRAPSPTPSNMDRFNDLGDDDAAVDLSPGLVERQSASVTPSIPSPAVTKDLHVAEEDDPVNPVASKEGPVQTVLEQMVKMGHVTSEQLLKLFSMPSQGAKVNFDEEAYLERRVYDSPIAEQIRIMEEGRPPTGLAGDSMPRVRADKIYPEQLIWMFDGEVTRFLQLSKQVWEGANHGGWNPEVGSSSTARDHAHGRETPAPTTRTADSRDVLPSFDQLSTEPGAYPTRTTDDAYKVVAASMEELARGGKLPHFMKQLHQHKAVSAAMKKETGQVNGRPFAELTLDEQDEELRRLEVRMAEAKREEMRSLKELEKLSRKNRKLIQEVLSV